MLRSPREGEATKQETEEHQVSLRLDKMWILLRNCLGEFK